MTEEIFNEKRKCSKLLKNYYNFKNKNKATGLIIVKDDKNIDFLLDGLEILSSNFVIETRLEFERRLNIIPDKNIKKDLITGFDFLVTDNESEGLNAFFGKGIVPIIPDNNHLSGILKEFDPIKSEGNSFLYRNNNRWSMYYAIVRYLENYKFVYDNRILVKNIASL